MAGRLLSARLRWPALSRPHVIKGLVVMLAAALLLNAISPASAGARPTRPVAQNQAAGQIMPVTSCSSLAQMDYAKVPDAPGKVTSAAVVTDVG